MGTLPHNERPEGQTGILDASIVIPVFNEEKYIGRCLDAICRLQTSKQFEVIVVDNNSTDRTAEITKRYASQLNLRIIEEKRKGVSAARYAGFRAAGGSVILSTDADTEVYPSWLDDLVDALRGSEELVAVTGHCTIDDCSWHVNFVYNVVKPLITKRFHYFLFRYYPLIGASFAVKREAYRISGGFDPNLGAHEDVYISKKLCKVGKTHFIPRPAVHFSGRRFRNGWLRVLLHQTGTFASVFLLQKKHVRKPDIR